MKEYFDKYLIDIFKNHYIDFKEKMDRKTYLFFFLNWTIIYLIVGSLCFLIPLLPVILDKDINNVLLTISSIILVLLASFILIPCFFACIRRQRDINEKKWYLFFLLFLIPVIGSFIYTILLCVLPGENERKNKQTNIK